MVQDLLKTWPYVHFLLPEIQLTRPNYKGDEGDSCFAIETELTHPLLTLRNEDQAFPCIHLIILVFVEPFQNFNRTQMCVLWIMKVSEKF